MLRVLARLADRALCAVACHDWRNMDGVCASCGYRDALWREGWLD